MHTLHVEHGPSPEGGSSKVIRMINNAGISRPPSQHKKIPGDVSVCLTNNLPIAAQALMQVVDNQANENIRGNDDSPTDELLLDNGLEEEEEEEEEQLPLHDHEDAVEQEITEGPEPVGEVGEDTIENDFPGATGMIWE